MFTWVSSECAGFPTIKASVYMSGSDFEVVPYWSGCPLLLRDGLNAETRFKYLYICVFFTVVVKNTLTKNKT